MSKRRVCLLTVKSLSAFPKVRFPGDSSCPFKSTFLSRNLSTAQSLKLPTDDFGGVSPNERQSHAGSWSNPRASGLNPDGGFGDTDGNSWNYQDREKGNLAGFSGPDYTENTNRNYCGNGSSFNQNSVLENNGSVGGNYGYGNEQFQQNLQGSNMPNSWNSRATYQQGLQGSNIPNSRNSDSLYRVNDNVQRTGQGYMENANGNVQNPNGYWSRGLSPSQNSLHLQNGMYEHGAGSSGMMHHRLPPMQDGHNLNDGLNQQQAGTQAGAMAFGSAMDGDLLEELDKFCKDGKAKEAVEILLKLQGMQVTVNFDCLLRLISVCGESMALKEAKQVHEHIMRAMSSPDVNTYNKIMEMYSKCGAMDDALDVFNNMPERDWISWDTMITWLAKNELGEDAIDLFTQFKEAGFRPNSKMFIGVFLACGVLGDMDEGMFHLISMKNDFDIIPTMEHHLSIVQMLGSAGYLDEALEFIHKMHLEQNVNVWETLMYLSRVQGNLELGDRCAEIVEQLDPTRLDKESKAGLVPVRASDIALVREKKLASQNLLERRTQGYRAGDKSSPDTDKIYGLLRNLKAQMIEAGYVPETRFVLHDVDQESKEEAIHAHSERLALAQGFLTSPARMPVRVTKNLRVCGDCHNACKIISYIVGRQLIMRDNKRFHHMKDGVCSCNDYW